MERPIESASPGWPTPSRDSAERGRVTFATRPHAPLRAAMRPAESETTSTRVLRASRRSREALDRPGGRRVARPMDPMDHRRGDLPRELPPGRVRGVLDGPRDPVHLGLEMTGRPGHRSPASGLITGRTSLSGSAGSVVRVERRGRGARLRIAMPPAARQVSSAAWSRLDGSEGVGQRRLLCQTREACPAQVHPSGPPCLRERTPPTLAASQRQA